MDLIGSAVRAAESAWGPVRVRAIGVTGLAESGVLLDAAGPAAPVIAWFDHRGGHEIEQLAREAPGFAAAFERTTGLRWSSQATLAKLLWLRASGQPAWPGLDLAQRAGMDRLRPGRRPGARAVAGVPDRSRRPGHRPPLAAGPGGGRAARPDSPRGTASLLPGRVPAARRCRSCAAGAVLTVAGHDHPVAAVGVGAVGADELFNSSGTADVLARSIPGTLPEAERQQVVTAGWSLGRHVLPDTSLLLAGISGGLLLRRVLAALGAEAEPVR